MAKVNNPPFPHTCEIYRIEGETSFEDGVKTTIYKGECRKDSSTSLRTFFSNNVAKSDYALYIPDTIRGVLSGDYADVTDFQGTTTRNIIVDCTATGMGTTVYFNQAKN